MSCEAENLDEVILFDVPSTGQQIFDVGSYDDPIVITGVLAIPLHPRVRIFISCAVAVLNPVIQNGVGSQEVYIYYVGGAGSLELDNQANLKLSGSWEPSPDAILSLQWVPLANKYTEVCRNEL